MVLNHFLYSDLVNLYDNDFQLHAEEVFGEIYFYGKATLKNSDLIYVHRTYKTFEFFSKVILNVSINYYLQDQDVCDKIDAAMKVYGQNIKKMELYTAKIYSMHSIQSPLSMVQVVTLCLGTQSIILPRFNEIFPIAHTLKLINLENPDLTDGMSLRYFPCDENLEIHRILQEPTVFDNFTRKLIKYNQQLKTFIHE